MTLATYIAVTSIYRVILVICPSFFCQELATPVLDDQPLYVNAKQYHRILKRRQQRAKLEALGKLPKTRQVLGTCLSYFNSDTYHTNQMFGYDYMPSLADN